MDIVTRETGGLGYMYRKAPSGLMKLGTVHNRLTTSYFSLPHFPPHPLSPQLSSTSPFPSFSAGSSGSSQTSFPATPSPFPPLAPLLEQWHWRKRYERPGVCEVGCGASCWAWIALMVHWTLVGLMPSCCRALTVLVEEGTWMTLQGQCCAWPSLLRARENFLGGDGYGFDTVHVSEQALLLVMTT